MRKTKIVCTLGPACRNAETLKEMCLAGMNVARLNFSHGDYAEHLENLNLIKAVRQELNLPIAIMLDTKGPEYRIKTFKERKVFLKDGDLFTFTADDVEGDQTKVSVSYKHLAQELDINDRILLNNGLLVFSVEQIVGNNIVCRVLSGGELSDRKSMAFPNKVLKNKYLSQQDKDDILFGLENDIDFIACSFVSCAQDLRDIKKFINKKSPDSKVSLIAKIENRAGVENIEEICRECDGILIGRGDMGVEIPFEELPHIQKHLITQCRLQGRQVITATEMLESMIHNPRPTRAEISDVANAVYDSTDAIMLSGETAAGKHPVLAVKTMARIAEETEKKIDYKKRFLKSDFKTQNVIDALSHSTCTMAIDVDAKAIVVCSLSGITAKMVARFRPPVDILGLTVNEKSQRQLALSWGVTPVLTEIYKSTDVLFYSASKIAKAVLNLQSNNRIVISGGNANGVSGNSDIIKIETI